MATLSEAEVRGKLQSLAGWKLASGNLERVFTFESFLPAIAFVNRVAGAAESAGHHPDIAINYNRVTLALSTHSAGGITQKDFDLAREIDRLQGGA
ncbi:MAG TPA: 4a-hydroxytetrahydrobiopterin dehydratase [Terriglobia bacterium]|nr:4a-hydroxytetrahydrobiopterin dehydratase [Terriglobia bacterium]